MVFEHGGRIGYRRLKTRERKDDGEGTMNEKKGDNFLVEVPRCHVTEPKICGAMFIRNLFTEEVGELIFTSRVVRNRERMQCKKMG